MSRMKKILTIFVLSAVMVVGTPTVFADGPGELPGVTEGPGELPGLTDEGPGELPGVTEVIAVLLGTTYIP